MHITDQRAFAHFDKIRSLMQSCEVFANEIDLAQSADPKLLALMHLPPENSLSNLLSKKDYLRLDKILKNINGPSIEMFENIIPMQTMGALSNQVLGAENHEVLDFALYNIATELQLEKTGLETLEDHMIVLKTIDIDEQIKMLKAVIRNFRSYKKLTIKMLDLYLEGNVQKIYKIGRKNVRKFNKVLLLNRNIIMKDSFLTISRDQRLFAAIGAGHLGGKNGLLRLLKKHGKKVTPILLP